jgi:histidine triad (HIT) family protein
MTMADCLFCKIINGEIPSNKVYEDGKVFAFRDINPQAPVHVLVIPKEHIASVGAAEDVDAETLAACLKACAKVAKLEGVAESGFRVVSNCGDDACQSVHHLHFHVLGGKKLAENMA